MADIVSLLSAMLMAPADLPSGSDKTHQPPNIVVILADDLGYGDLRCYNKASRIPTPHIDGLATQGMRFTDAHSPSSVCTPTRYGILTGRYCWRSRLKQGVLFGYDPLLIEPGRMTIASLLRLYRYITACIGKWHLGLGSAGRTDYTKALRPGPNAVGFDYFHGFPAALDMAPYVFIENERVVRLPTERTAGRNDGKVFWRPGPIAPGFKHEEVLGHLTDKAVAFINKQSSERPFFLYFALTAPHMPVVPGKQFEGKSQVGAYGDLVMELDHSVGRVLKALEDARLAENTLVIFTSDNGAYWESADIARWKHRANGDLHGQKADIWEGGHRVPFIARWPGKVPAGATSHEVICLTDLLATAAAIVGARLPVDAAEDSFDLLPVLTGKKLDRPVRDTIIHHSFDGTFAIRQGPWRLAPALGSHGFSQPRNIEPAPGQARGELYNLANDPKETTNLWLQRPEIVQRLDGLLEKTKVDGRSRRGARASRGNDQSRSTAPGAACKRESTARTKVAVRNRYANAGDELAR
jgi:arylsulfatase A-like enzyme